MPRRIDDNPLKRANAAREVEKPKRKDTRKRDRRGYIRPFVYRNKAAHEEYLLQPCCFCGYNGSAKRLKTLDGSPRTASQDLFRSERFFQKRLRQCVVVCYNCFEERSSPFQPQLKAHAAIFVPRRRLKRHVEANMPKEELQHVDYRLESEKLAPPNNYSPPQDCLIAERDLLPSEPVGIKSPTPLPDAETQSLTAALAQRVEALAAQMSREEQDD